MVNWKFWKKGEPKDGEKQVKYILKRRVASGGMAKVLELNAPVKIDDVYRHLEPGTYALHKYTKGQSGFESLWEHEILGEEAPTPGAPARRASPFTGLRQYAEDMKGMKEDIGVFLEVFGPMAGYSKAGEGKPQGLIEQLKEAREMKDTLEKIFPSSTTKSQDIPIAGSIPAWMVFTPQVIDQAMDSVEKRLHRWGVIEEAGLGEAKEREIIKLPEKPKAVRKEKPKPAEVEEIKEKEAITLPPKPVEKTGIRKVEVEEKKEEEKKKKDVKGTGKTRSKS